MRHQAFPEFRTLIRGGLLVLAVLLWGGAEARGQRGLDESPAQPGEWGYHPAEEDVSAIDPPSFSWRPQEDIEGWEVECRAESGEGTVIYHSNALEMNVHRPPVPFGSGRYVWRYRGITRSGDKTKWSQSRPFVIDKDAVEMPLPPREELLARVPDQHPRLFIRPDDVARLRQLAHGALREEFAQLVDRCEQILQDPPPTAEPPKYGDDVEYKSEQWRSTWWGNRTYTIAALDSAATLGFTRLLNDNPEYGELAKEILLACAEWDPVGATGYRYNDEAGMPYAYHFARTYTFIYDLLDEQERTKCREVLRVRGNEMYGHLYPHHLWRPYSSHSNRAWHFLGELGIALHGELEEADDWVWFATNVFHNVYPVWSDQDGGWHEGFAYWNSYLSRFTWWADIMHSALGIDAYRKPFFSQMGYYPMYLMPPGKVGAGFGDLNAGKVAEDARSLMSQITRQAGNGHWQWYVDQLGGDQRVSSYVDFIRASLPPVEPQPPEDLPTSRLFAGTGQAMLNSDLLQAADSVQVVFKSSPFGTQSHGYEANNSFLLWAYGKRLLVRSGYRDIYGSDHHRNWMWSTRSVNNITVGGQGQLKHSPHAQGKIVHFHTSPAVDVVVGEAGGAYRDRPEDQSALERFTRAIVFLKPNKVLVFDLLQATEPATFEYHLHSPFKFETRDDSLLRLTDEDVHCDIRLLAPGELKMSQTNQYDPNPRSRVSLREWHLTAATAQPARQTHFLALLEPYRTSDSSDSRFDVRRSDEGYVVQITTDAGETTVLLPTSEHQSLRAEGLEARGEIVIRSARDDRHIRLPLADEDPSDER